MSDDYYRPFEGIAHIIDLGEVRRIRKMFSPVRCAHCNRVYDLGTVTVTARYTDCSVWNAPCCGRPVDDRGETGWKTLRDYHKIDKRDLPRFPHEDL